MRKITTTRRAGSRFPKTFLFAASCLLLLLSGCLKDKITKTYTIVRPVYSLKTAFLANLNGSAAQPIDSIGRIYAKDQFIYLNEPEKGIHIIDNSDPAHPVQTAFLNIPGNEEIAIKGNTLYADMYRELLAIDISDPHQVKVTGMTAGVFPDRYYNMTGYNSMYSGGTNVDSNLLLTGYITKDTTISSGDPNKTFSYLVTGTGFFTDAMTPSASVANSSGTGVAGSTAKMVLLNNFLYTIPESHSLGIIDVSNASNPVPIPAFSAGLDLETIYPFGDKLFLGSQEGVYIYDVSNPAKPVQQGLFTHGRACDPVIADGSYAYVTLHAGTSCGGSSNELDVLNVQDLLHPGLIATIPMTSPQGLCKDDNLLFVCDGSAGVKLFDAGNPADLHLLSAIGIPDASDIIAGNQRLLVIANGSLYQVDYSNPADLRLISTLSVK